MSKPTWTEEPRYIIGRRKIAISVRIDKEDNRLCSQHCDFLKRTARAKHSRCKLFAALAYQNDFLKNESIADRRTDEKFRPKRCEACMKQFGMP